jgi:hypothetical protein
VNQSKAFYKQLKQVLKKRFRYDKVLASYSIKYNDTDGIREYLQHRGSFVRRSGKYLKSPLLTIDPVVRKTYEHLEYRPLVNARAHQLGKQRKIVNGRFYQQYQKLLGVLKYKAQLGQDDLMAVTYYLLLQDRVHEAMQAFGKVKRSKLATKMQYDYFAAYMAFYKADLKTARAVASKYKIYSIVRWRKLFLQVLSQLDEIEGKKSKVVDPKDRTERQTRLASAEASFQFKVDAKQIRVSYQNVKALRVNYYKMDIELLFSRNPFLKQPGGQFTYIQPNATQLVTLKGSKGKTTFALPKALQSSNVMIEMLADGERQTSAYYANALDVQVMENYGQIKVTHETSGKALAKVYVKVYAKRKNGQVRFYKDGYTDLRGRFDYSSLSTNDLDHTKRFSILILSKQHGAVVREAAPPKQ